MHRKLWYMYCCMTTIVELTELRAGSMESSSPRLVSVLCAESSTSTRWKVAGTYCTTLRLLPSALEISTSVSFLDLRRLRRCTLANCLFRLCSFRLCRRFPLWPVAFQSSIAEACNCRGIACHAHASAPHSSLHGWWVSHHAQEAARSMLGLCLCR